MTLFFDGFCTGFCFQIRKELWTLTISKIHPQRANVSICICQSFGLSFFPMHLKCFAGLFVKPSLNLSPNFKQYFVRNECLCSSRFSLSHHNEQNTTVLRESFHLYMLSRISKENMFVWNKNQDWIAIVAQKGIEQCSLYSNEILCRFSIS